MSAPSRPTRFCVWCGAPLPPHRRAYCSDTCLAACTTDQSVTGHGRQYATPYMPKPKRYRSPINDAQQMQLNQQIDQRHAVKLEPPRHLKPGHPDFDRIAAQCTDPRHIKDRSSVYNGGDYAVSRG